uniref:Uncharacterized protein n=1 Tax=Larimichthys crocea TaxID=215358 RepID=A0A0F8AM26_LARCR
MKAHGNAKYTSKTIQNEMLEFLAEMVQQDIIRTGADGAAVMSGKHSHKDDEYSEQENNDEEDVGEEDDEEEEEKDGFQTLKYKNNRKTTNTGLRLALIVS